MAVETQDAASENPAPLERGRRLSESMLWRYERRFFHRMGIGSWSEGHVPQYITTNPHIARCYARVVLGWARDCAASLEPGAVLPVIELGSGSGRFAFHFLTSIRAAWKSPATRSLRLRFVMTDFSERNVEFWRGHPRLAPFVDAGMLDFALFDPTTSDSLELLHARETLAPGRVDGPIAFLANYFFDSTPQDCFAVERGTLLECLPVVTCDGPAPPEDDHDWIARMKIEFDRRPADPDPYDDPDWNAILRSYAGRLDDTVFTFPVAGLRCLNNLSALSGGRMLLLSADKGWVREEELLGRPAPRFTPHGGCFSLPVNYHALAEAVRRRGGRSLLPPRPFHLAIVALLLGEDDHDWGETRLAFDESIVQAGPDAFFSIKKGVESAGEAFHPEQILAWLRLSGWDPRLLGESAQAMIQAASSLDEVLRQEWIRAIDRVWENYYHIGEEQDIPFVLGRLLLALGRPRQALPHLLRSVEWYGPAAASFYYMAECHQHLGELLEALDCLDRALEVEPDAGPVRAERIKLMAATAAEDPTPSHAEPGLASLAVRPRQAGAGGSDSHADDQDLPEVA